MYVLRNITDGRYVAQPEDPESASYESTSSVERAKLFGSVEAVLLWAARRGAELQKPKRWGSGPWLPLDAYSWDFEIVAIETILGPRMGVGSVVAR